MMYKIIGADQKEYGPVSAEQLRQWLAEGRANAQTPVQAAGTAGWKPLAAYPEFAALLPADALAAATPPGYDAPRELPEDIFARDYDLDIGGCLGRAWELLKGNFALVAGGVAVYLFSQIAISGLALLCPILFSRLTHTPFVEIAGNLVSLVIAGPLTGGVFYFLLKNIRRQPTGISDVFAGFRRAFGQLLLGYVVMIILIYLAMLPGVALMVWPLLTLARQQAVAAGPIFVALLGFICLIVPAIYLSVSWTFLLPLIIDRQMKFGPAMKASRRMVGKHWWQVFGLVAVCGLINVVGLLFCGVGIFLTLPIALGAILYAYESIFSPPAAPAAYRAAARNATLLNLCATPGLGSLIAGRRAAGLGQLLLAIAGFGAVCGWLVLVAWQIYNAATRGAELRPTGWLGGAGAALFALAWIWSLFTSLSLLREARANEPGAGRPPPL
ncbi:MAG TPA: GYF domain-containing protein [Verrucomicrobiota bacterium]|nr:GYF domain-containing protein [Verrucomicrobiota bacterium]